ncbi:MAG: tetratricopeptide repeat protein [Alphaproteobacteria bacterium]|nr:tetratricopeptide repeat protein [Alphaproteobacteria bacterium]
MSAKQKRIERALAQAQGLLQGGRAADAATLCEEILREAPHLPSALQLGAVAAFQSGDGNRARDLLETATTQYPDDPEAHFNLGVLYQSSGILESALGAFLRAAALAPGSAIAHYNAGTALHELGRPGEAIAAYRRAIDADPDYAAAHAGLAYLLRDAGQLEDALTAYDSAVALAPNDAQTQSGRGIVLQHLGRLPEAADALRRAAALDPAYPDACTNLADVLIEMDDAVSAVRECDRFLSRYPGDSGVLASKVIALGESGDTEAADALVDFERFLCPTRPEPPPGFADAGALNDALAAHMLAHPTLVDAPASHATRNGKHTGELLGDTAAPIVAFQAMMSNAIALYKSKLGDDPAHPFVANALDCWRLTAWSIVLQGSGGFQAPHIHPSAWLSGVYYARVPDVVSDPNAGQAGWIEFGLPSEEYHWRCRPPVRAIRPEAGLLVLFPSYFFHRTIPYDTEGTRISIAFDVLPAIS